jgi:1,4-dihydroxy-2-naphthoate octaprenyltransferase
VYNLDNKNTTNQSGIIICIKLLTNLVYFTQMGFNLKASTIQLLRIKFSFFLMPVFWFALSQINNINIFKAVLVFVILHIFIYPASNGYNSYMDKDTESIGCIEKPLPSTQQLYYATIFLDIAGLLSGLLVNTQFTFLLLLYILASKSYSYSGIRLKRFPLLSYIIAIVFQGSIVYFMVYNYCSIQQNNYLPLLPMAVSTLFVGSFYPLTQIYQHKQDAAANIKTMSIMLGYTGTFLLSFFMSFTAMLFIAYYFASNLELDRFLVLLACMLPSVFFSLRWYIKVRRNTEEASFKNCMLSNWIAATGSNLAFIIILIIKI